ncbi:hypothetical protein TanjilG_05587 [Lupinus angustifolius]|uniref:Non-haem dioxygenase N-terminal domain-containing protein n=1 Tax=Lupinus angustifolius TaxID=3871 RepID=A0A4P1QSL8_LUPAN|nr:hypothetical protein TanjilG_05587 [Lupinus angustifolius]
MDSGLLLSALNHNIQLPKVPTNFIWPKEYLVEAHEELQAPMVDLNGFLKGDENATHYASKTIAQACLNHGFFQSGQPWC